MAVTIPSDKHFLRSQIYTPRRRRPRGRSVARLARIAVAAIILGAGGYWSARAVADLRWLRVQHITVTGNHRVSAGEIIALVDGLKGDNVLATDLVRWRSRLLASPWVADATLRRRLPATVEIEIRERTPLGLARIGHELHLVDATGTIDEFGPRYADLDLPMIDGLIRDAGSPRPRVDPERAQAVGRLMADLRSKPALAARVSQIDANDAHDLHVILNGDSAVIRLGDTLFAERLQSYTELQATLRERVPDIDYVDLRFGERVYVGPAHLAAAASRTPVTTPPSRDAREPDQP
ncbi:MAG: FtsQ-type POTRA domain-containing protein [Acidobacteriota bacterium]